MRFYTFLDVPNKFEPNPAKNSIACAVGTPCGHLVAKICVCWDYCSQIVDLHKILVDLVCITLKVKNVLKTSSLLHHQRC